MTIPNRKFLKLSSQKFLILIHLTFIQSVVCKFFQSCLKFNFEFLKVFFFINHFLLFPQNCETIENIPSVALKFAPKLCVFISVSKTCSLSLMVRKLAVKYLSHPPHSIVIFYEWKDFYSHWRALGGNYPQVC